MSKQIHSNTVFGIENRIFRSPFNYFVTFESCRVLIFIVVLLIFLLYFIYFYRKNITFQRNFNIFAHKRLTKRLKKCMLNEYNCVAR